MLTVKLIDDQAQEDLFEAKSVSLLTHANAQTNTQKELHIVHDGGETIVDTGHVFVMNENGKTVADYHFPPKVNLPPEVNTAVGGQIPNFTADVSNGMATK